MDYLRVINQPDNNDSLSRIINTPSRRIGEATIKSLLEEADQAKVTLWHLILSSVQGKLTTKTKINKQTEQSLSSFVNIILTARAKRAGPVGDRLDTVQLIGFVLQKTDYENWLVDHHGDVTKARWENVQELLTQATDFQDLISCGYEDESLPEIDGLEQEADGDHLSRFLANVALASEVKNDDDEGAPKAQVTISTIHAAKGLEWPVVFIPATYQGSIPHSRAEDSNEERRLLYVAMTRAKALLYMSYPMKNTQAEQTALSPFLAHPSLGKLLDQKGPLLRSSAVQSIAQILRRALPSAQSISKSSAMLTNTEDDRFPVDGEDGEHDNDLKWNLTTGSQHYTMGQQAPKRRRIELGRPVSSSEAVSEPNWKPSYATTMDRASTLTSASVTMKSGFVSAGSHLQALKEQSVNCQVGGLEVGEKDQEPSRKVSGRQKKGLEGQGTLLGFLGKPEPAPSKRPAPNTLPAGHPKEHKQVSQGPIMNMDIHRPRISSAIDQPAGISTSLSSHRLGPKQTGSRPRTNTSFDQHQRNDYVFLSSSPPRKKATSPEPVPEKPPALTTKPAILPLIRPATSMHMTSVSMLQGESGVKKTLGMRRSMNGWESRKGQGFKPPTMRRPG